MTRRAATRTTTFLLAVAITALLTIRWTGPAFWLLALVASAAGLAWSAIWCVRSWRRIDAELDTLIATIPAHACAAHGHYYKPVTVAAGLNHHVWRCQECGEHVLVGQAAVYDQDAS